MNAIKSARKFIVANPASESARTLAQLVLALQSESDFQIANLYKLELETFEIAIDILKEWRIDRYYAGKAKLFDLSLQVSNLPG
jgi:2-methylcitrate dehydratase PrpD